MKRKVQIAAVLFSAPVVFAIAGCSATPDAAPTPSIGIKEPQGPGSRVATSGDRVMLFDNLQQLVDASPIIVIGTVTEQPGPLDRYSFANTVSKVQVIETFKGDVAVGDTLETMDFATSEFVMEGASGVPNIGGTYLFFLNPIGEFSDGNGNMIDASHVFVNVIPLHFVVDGDVFTMDFLDSDDTMPSQFSRTELLATLG